jgi:hypothetical protein
MFSWLKDLAGPILGIGADWIKGVSERKRAEIEAKTTIAVSKEQARSTIAVGHAETANELAKTGQKADIDWDLLQADASRTSWRDEYLIILISFPFIGCFIPAFQAYVLSGFETLQQTPDWYQTSFMVIVAASFGIRAVATNFMNKGKRK